MPDTVPTPPPAEAKRQKLVHALRAQKVGYATGLITLGFNDNSTLSYIQKLNDQIDLLKYMREPFPDTELEPSFDAIVARSENWYWEPWDEEDEEDDE